jgi:hypothetical protein
VECNGIVGSFPYTYLDNIRMEKPKSTEKPSIPPPRAPSKITPRYEFVIFFTILEQKKIMEAITADPTRLEKLQKKMEELDNIAKNDFGELSKAMLKYQQITECEIIFNFHNEISFS